MVGAVSQTGDKAAEIDKPAIADFDQTVDLLTPNVSGIGLAPQSIQPDADPDIGLDYAVMKVAGNLFAIFGRRLQDQPIHQARIVDDRHDLFDHLQDKVHVRV